VQIRKFFKLLAILGFRPRLTSHSLSRQLFCEAAPLSCEFCALNVNYKVKQCQILFIFLSMHVEYKNFKCNIRILVSYSFGSIKNYA
jgi:hypothetical protein